MFLDMGTAVYVRISDDRRGEGLGVARQEADCRALCKRRKWSAPTVIVDNDVSAYSRKPRPGYLRLVDGIKGGEFTRVVVWHPDRLHRSPRELEDFIDLIETTGCEVVSVTAGDYDLATPEGRLMARITGSVARKESEDKSRRLRRKHLELAEAGMDPGGRHRPFGYSDPYTLDVAEAKVVVEITDRLLAGETLRGVARDLNQRGIETSTGSPWTALYVKRIATSGRICGWREHHGEMVTTARWPAIVDREIVDRLRALLRDPARRLNVRSRRYLLTGGIARCGIDGCAMALHARPRSGGDRCYICATDLGGCGKIRRAAGPVEGFVAALLFLRLDSDEYAAAVAAEDGKPSDGDPVIEVRALEAKLEHLAADWAADLISRGEWMLARQTVEQRLRAAQRRLAAVPTRPLAPGSGKALEASWESMTFDQQRSIIDSAVARVDVLPAVKGRNKFDPTKIFVTWKV